MSITKNTDVLIVGSGIAGLSTALMLSDDIQVTMITKGKINDCSTAWAQGGVASVLSKSDSFDKHIQDTIKNGKGIVSEKIAAEIIHNGPLCIDWLIKNGVKFTTDKENKIDLTLEGAHSERRVAYIKDETGAKIHSTLYKKVKQKNNIT